MATDPKIPDLVDAFLDGDVARISAIVDSVPRGHKLYPCLSAIHEAVVALLDRVPPIRAFQRINHLAKKDSFDADIQFLLLRLGSQLAIRLNRHDEARHFLGLARSVQDGTVRPELKAALLLSEAALLEIVADYEQAADRCSKALDLGIRVPGAFWAQLKSHRAYYAICDHDFGLAQRDIRDIEAHPGLQSNLIAPVLALNAQLYCESGRPDMGLALLDAASEEDAGLDRSRYVTLCVKLLLHARRLDEAGVMLDQAEHENGSLLEPTSRTLRALESLAHGEIESARTHARGAIIGVDRGLPSDFEFALRTLAGVELAARQTREASRILARLDPRRAKMSSQMLWARLHLLQNEFGHAVEYYRRVAAHGAVYVAQQVRNAAEMSACDLARLQAEVEPTGTGPSDPGSPGAQSETPDPGDDNLALVGESEPMVRVRHLITAFARLPAPVLITGETGTGKDVAARLLHAGSSRREEAFIPLNCGALSDTLIESELFGHVKGAFTGADRDHDGLFVAAGRGTIFLDEIHAMSPRLQAALLRVLENGEVRPVGSSRFRRTEAKVIAATNEAIEWLIEQKRFRTDLYYRLAKLRIDMPSLRDRPEDVSTLAGHFVRRMVGHDDVVLADDLLRALRRHPWPGNVRELRNEIERIVLTAGHARVLTARWFKPDGNGEQVTDIATSFLRDEGPAAEAVPLPSANQRHTWTRRRRLRQLMQQYDRLTRAEVIQLLGCSPNTATRDLRALEQEGFVRRVHTSAHLRTSYFVLNGEG